MSGRGEAKDEDGGGGGFDFFRSRCAQEKSPPLFCLGGTETAEPGSLYSLELVREWEIGCVGNDLVEWALVGSLYAEKTADVGGGGLRMLFSDSDRILKYAEGGGER